MTKKIEKERGSAEGPSTCTWWEAHPALYAYLLFANATRNLYIIVVQSVNITLHVNHATKRRGGKMFLYFMPSLLFSSPVIAFRSELPHLHLPDTAGTKRTYRCSSHTTVEGGKGGRERKREMMVFFPSVTKEQRWKQRGTRGNDQWGEGTKASIF